ncbi:DUF4265 domain-containing protein [Archangium sp.]|uniref:DUF4265 domain-containing protein n=1 Tax=Archangium sp. TaxID=1872627 RepID=UPI002D45B4BC|nr:DUF4265 domain-containing protein [Archangium sp.]HYO51176.1 DUF4265 domain-containing protein [Archangium sp.]
MFFRLEEGAWHGSATESLWAEPVPGGRFLLRNSPFYALEPLRQAGCSYEEGPGRLLAVDVSPLADIQHVYSLLEQGEQAQVWHFEEGHRGHAVAD